MQKTFKIQIFPKMPARASLSLIDSDVIQTRRLLCSAPPWPFYWHKKCPRGDRRLYWDQKSTCNNCKHNTANTTLDNWDTSSHLCPWPNTKSRIRRKREPGSGIFLFNLMRDSWKLNMHCVRWKHDCPFGWYFFSLTAVIYFVSHTHRVFFLYRCSLN